MRVVIGYNDNISTGIPPVGRRYYIAVFVPPRDRIERCEYLHYDGIIRGSTRRDRSPDESEDADVYSGYYESLNDACSSLRHHIRRNRTLHLDISFELPDELYPVKAHQLIETPDRWT